MEFSAKQIAAFTGGEIVGDENATVHTFAKIEEGTPGALSFLANPKYTPYIYNTQSSIVLVNRDFTPEQEVKATLIKVDNALRQPGPPAQPLRAEQAPAAGHQPPGLGGRHGTDRAARPTLAPSP